MSEDTECGTKLGWGLKIFFGLLVLLPIVAGGALIWTAITSAPGEVHSRLGMGIGGGVIVLLLPILMGITLIRRKRKYGTFRQTAEERAEIRARRSQQTPQPMALRIGLPVLYVVLAMITTYKSFHDDRQWFLPAVYWLNAFLWIGMAFRKQPFNDPGALISLNLQ